MLSIASQATYSSIDPSTRRTSMGFTGILAIIVCLLVVGSVTLIVRSIREKQFKKAIATAIGLAAAIFLIYYMLLTLITSM